MMSVFLFYLLILYQDEHMRFILLLLLRLAGFRIRTGIEEAPIRHSKTLVLFPIESPLLKSKKMKQYIQKRHKTTK